MPRTRNIGKIHRTPRCLNRYCNVYQLLLAFSVRQSSAPEAARRIGMPLISAEGAAARLKKLKFIEHIPDEGYYVTELGFQALTNTPNVTRPKALTVKLSRDKLVKKLMRVPATLEKRKLIVDILERLNSENPAVYRKARREATEIVYDKRVVRMPMADVTAAVQWWLRQRFKIEGRLDIEFTGDDKQPISVVSVLTEKE